MLHQRILMQKCVHGSKRLPDASLIDKFTDHSAKLSTNVHACKRNLKAHIKDLQSIQKNMFVLSETPVRFNYPSEDHVVDTTEMLWKHLDANFNKSLPFVEQSINKWNNRTQLLGGIKKSSAFNQSILQ